MKTFNRAIVLPMLVILASFASGCEVIGDIFEAGVWSGVLLVVGGILLVVFLIAKVFGGKNK